MWIKLRVKSPGISTLNFPLEKSPTYIHSLIECTLDTYCFASSGEAQRPRGGWKTRVKCTGGSVVEIRTCCKRDCETFDQKTFIWTTYPILATKNLHDKGIANSPPRCCCFYKGKEYVSRNIGDETLIEWMILGKTILRANPSIMNFYMTLSHVKNYILSRKRNIHSIARDACLRRINFARSNNWNAEGSIERGTRDQPETPPLFWIEQNRGVSRQVASWTETSREKIEQGIFNTD